MEAMQGGDGDHRRRWRQKWPGRGDGGHRGWKAKWGRGGGMEATGDG